MEVRSNWTWCRTWCIINWSQCLLERVAHSLAVERQELKLSLVEPGPTRIGWMHYIFDVDLHELGVVVTRWRCWGFSANTISFSHYSFVFYVCFVITLKRWVVEHKRLVLNRDFKKKCPIWHSKRKNVTL